MKIPFSWIDQSNTYQLEWAARYLARKEFDGSLSGWHLQHLKKNEYHHTATTLCSVPNDAEFRELSEMMKGAWKTQQNRKKYGNPVSLQMPKSTHKQLKNLAKKRKKSQAETLSQIISDAARDKSRVNDQSNNAKEPLLDEQSAHLYSKDVDSLLDALLDEISHRCSLNVLANGGDPSLDFNLRRMHTDLVKERVSELASKISLLQSSNGHPSASLHERALKKGWKYGFPYY